MMERYSLERSLCFVETNYWCEDSVTRTRREYRTNHEWHFLLAKITEEIDKKNLENLA